MNYSKVGCLQCKKAHQKCDEKIPKCDRCLRRSLNCHYFSNFIVENIKSGFKGRRIAKKSQKKSKKGKTTFSAYIPVTERPIGTEICERDYRHIDEIDSIKEQGSIHGKKSSRIEVIKCHKDDTEGSFAFDKPQKVKSVVTSPPISTNSFLRLVNKKLDSPSSLIPHTSLELDVISSENGISQENTFLTSPAKVDMVSHESSSLDSHYNCIDTLPTSSQRNTSEVSFKRDELGNSNSTRKEAVGFPQKHTTVFDDRRHELTVSKKDEFVDMNHITLEDLVQIMPTDMDFLNMIEMDCEDFYSLKDNYIPHTSAFEVSWKNSVTVDFLGIFQRYDPIRDVFAERGYVSLKDVRMLNFIWTLNKGTRHYFNFPMYPLEIYNEVLGHCAKLNSIYPIIQSVMTYDCAMLLTGIYKRSNENELFSLWDRQIRIPSFKQCLDILKARVDTTTSFSESVVLTFAVIIIFSANSSDDSWRTHLKGSYQLVLKSSSLQSSIDPNNEIDYAASKIFEIVKEWFFNTDFLSHVSSNNGFQIDKNISLKYSRDPENSIAILDNGLSLIGGHSLELKPFFLKIQTVLSEFDSRGVRLCGNNFLVFKFTNTNKSLAAEVKSIGFELLMQLKELKYQYRRSKIHDYQMEFTLKNSDRLSRLALELYLAYFFIGNKSIEYYVKLLEEILEVIYSIPYYSTACIYCQWSIYLSALVALLHKKDELYQCFYNVLYSLRQNGMYVTENSLNRLAHIKGVTENKQYDQLLDPSMDFMLI